jgi:prepilin-type N-terminal cleavage/methylation domain-containing protein
MTAIRARRRRAQAGTTLIELLVATVIIGVALVLVVGMFSTGVIDSNLAKRDTGAQAATQYEVDRIDAAQYSANANSYSECFAADGSGAPTVVGFRGACPSAARIRADVSVAQVTVNGVALQQWTIRIAVWPGAAPIGTSLSLYKVNR